MPPHLKHLLTALYEGVFSARVRVLANIMRVLANLMRVSFLPVRVLANNYDDP